jgi:hypothetical protein
MKTRLLALVLVAGLALPAMAATVSCPDLSTAVQVGTCPPEEELRHTFTGYCSDNTNAYKGETDVCTDYQRYRKLKNVALWEAGDGGFTAYLFCDLPTLGVRQARASSIKVAKQGKMTHLVCGYAEGVNFTFRTRAECKVEGSGNCATNPAACRANCN